MLLSVTRLQRVGETLNSGDEEWNETELVNSRLNKLRSIQQANQVASRPLQFTLGQFFAATFVFALIGLVFARPFRSLAIAITVVCAFELIRSPLKGKLWTTIALAWILTVLESAAFWQWVSR